MGSIADTFDRALSGDQPENPAVNPRDVGGVIGDKRRMSNDEVLQVLQSQVKDPARDPSFDSELEKEMKRVQGVISKPARQQRPSRMNVFDSALQQPSESAPAPAAAARPDENMDARDLRAQQNQERDQALPEYAYLHPESKAPALEDAYLNTERAPWTGEGGVLTNAPAGMVAAGKNAAANLGWMATEEERKNRIEAMSEQTDPALYGSSAQFQKLAREAKARHEQALVHAETAGKEMKTWADQTQKELELVTPEHMDTLQQGVWSFVQSAPPQALGIAVGILTKNPWIGGAIAGGGGSGMQAGQTYGEAREKGATHRTAGMSAGVQGAIELSDFLPVGVALKPGSAFGKRLLHTAATEGATEAAQQFLQDMQSWAAYDPEMTLGQAWQNMQVAAIAGALGGAVFGTVGHIAQGKEPERPAITEDQARSIREQVKAIVDPMNTMQPLKRASAGPAEGFTGTHRLDDGTEVVPAKVQGKTEPGLWRDARGTLFEADRAEPITKTEPNATYASPGGTEYDVTVTGEGARKGSVRLSDGQEVSISKLTLDDDAKELLGLLPPKEQEVKKAPAKAETPEPKAPEKIQEKAAKPASNTEKETETAALEKPAAAQKRPAAPVGGETEPPPRGSRRPEPELAGPPPKLEGVRSLQRQNRLRESVASVAQMNQIANAPDYERLSFSKAPETGAPMASVAGDTEAIPAAQLGRASVVTIGGERVPVKYAVVEADKLMASHTVEGGQRAEYFGEAKPGEIRALNNGRAAGLREAYSRDTAAEYRKALEADTDHGIAPEVIRKMKRPVLLRVYPDEFNRKIENIGEKSQGETLQQSPLEVALQDSAKLASLEGFEPGEDGDVAAASNDDFVRRYLQTIVPEAERGRLFDPLTKKPNKAAYDRIEAAIFQKAYGSKALTGMFAEANEPEIRAVLSALAIAAPDMAMLEGAPEHLDVRPFIAEAAKLMVQAKRQGAKFAAFIKQQDIEGRNPLVQAFAEHMAEHIRSPRKMGAGLKASAKFGLWAVQDESTADIFGDKPKASVADALRALNKFMEVEYGEGNAAGERPADQAGKVAQDRAGYRAGRAPPVDTSQTGRNAEHDAKAGTAAEGAGEQVQEQNGPQARDRLTPEITDGLLRMQGEMSQVEKERVGVWLNGELARHEREGKEIAEHCLGA